MRRSTRAVLATAASAAGLAALTAWSRREVRRAEEAYPPEGRFLELGGGARLHVVEEGSGPDVVLIHGADGIALEFTGTVSAELARDHRVLTVERPGHGWSTLPDGATPDVALNAALIAEGLRQLGVARPLLVGHSYGGLTALAMAAERPGFARGLVLLAPVGAFPWPLPPRLLRAASAVARSRLLTDALVVPLGRGVLGALSRNAFHPAGVPDDFAAASRALYLRPAQFRALVSEYAHLRADVAGLAPLFAGIAEPVEIVAGAGDRVTRIAPHSRGLATLLPDAALTELPDAGHELMWTHPEAVLDAVRRVEERGR